jgi:trimeric autotransporter adhesin
MRKIILFLGLLLAGAMNVQAQSTTVSGTITDQGSVAWVSGTYSFDFVGPQNVNWPGGALTRHIAGNLDASGAFSQSVPDNNTISPSPTFWNFKVCPILGVKQSCFTQQFTITGGAQTLTVTPPAISTPGSTSLPVSAYADAEISAPVPRGFIYFQVTSATAGVYRQCSGLTGTACTTWTSIAAGAPAIPCGANTQIQFNDAGACGADADLTWDKTVGSLTVAGLANAQQSIGAGQNNLGINGVGAQNSVILTAGATGATLALSADTDATLTSVNGNVQVHVGTANPFNFPTATGGPGNVLTTDGANPQILTWTAAATGTVSNIATSSPLFGGPITTTGTLGIGYPDRSVAAASDPIVTGDRGGRVVYTNTGAVAVALPQAGSAGFTNNFYYDTANEGLGGVVTITPTVSTINGNATLVMQTGQSCRVGPNSTGTSYAADCSESQITAGANITLTRAIHGLTIALSTSPTFTTPNIGAATGTSLSVSGSLTSTVATGTAPLVVTSTTNVANLNASSLNGVTFAAPGAIGSGTPSTGAFTTISATGQITSTQATGSAPFVVASTTNVANLNASSLNGATFAAPGAIGGTTPSAGSFSALNCGVLNTTACVITGFGSTSGSAAITFPAVAGTVANAITISNAINVASSITASTDILGGQSNSVGINGRERLRSTADGIASISSSANAAGGTTQFVLGLIGNATNPEFAVSGTNVDIRDGANGTTGGSISVRGGTPMIGMLSATAALDFANQAAIGCNDLTITVTGAALGDPVELGVPNASVPNGTAVFSAWVSSANTVSVRYCNLVSGDPASGTFRATVHKF